MAVPERPQALLRERLRSRTPPAFRIHPEDLVGAVVAPVGVDEAIVLVGVDAQLRHACRVDAKVAVHRE
eukprot:7381233-Prymnesium_polylepis.1